MASSIFSVESNLSNDSVYMKTREAHQRIQSGEATQEDLRLNEEWSRARYEFDEMLKARGLRYASCSFDNYQCEIAEQREVVRKLKDYAINIEENMRIGKNVILFGPKGTGKDHLMIALAKACMMQARVVTHWINGPDLLVKFRNEALNGPEIFGSWESRCPVLGVSDLLPPSGVLSESQKHYFFKLVDERYSHMRPIWMTLNVASGDEAEERIGPQAVDRLRHDALALHCNWPSFRSKN